MSNRVESYKEFVMGIVLCLIELDQLDFVRRIAKCIYEFVNSTEFVWIIVRYLNEL